MILCEPLVSTLHEYLASSDLSTWFMISREPNRSTIESGALLLLLLLLLLLILELERFCCSKSARASLLIWYLTSDLLVVFPKSISCPFKRQLICGSGQACGKQSKEAASPIATNLSLGQILNCSLMSVICVGQRALKVSSGVLGGAEMG